MATLSWGNPYTHKAITRESEPTRGNPNLSCAWCGRKPRVLYRYYEGERAMGFGMAGALAFCNIECFHTYHGL